VKQALAVSLDPQEEKASTKSKEPQTGSYERLMSGLAPGITRPR